MRALPTLLAGAALSLSVSAQTDSTHAYGTSFDHAAACVAAFKPHAADLADRYRSGDESVAPELLAMTQTSLSIVGVAIQQGLQKAEADLLLASAEEFQRSVPPAKLAALVATCRTEGAAIMAAASPDERLRTASAARLRVQRIRTDD